jgi:NAD+ synthase (glutamine-hydrolysing)
LNNPYKIAAACLNQTPIDWENNFFNIASVIQGAKNQEVNLLCLPELCITGYGCEDLYLSDWIYEKAFLQLQKVVELTDNITIALGIPLQFDGENYNCAALVSNKQILGFSAKQFLANDGVHYETRWFTPWKAGEVQEIEFDGRFYPIGDIVYSVDNHRIAFEICEDSWRGRERPGFRHKEKGVDIILNPSASHFAFGKTALRQELVLNGSEWFECTYLFANLLGNEAGRMVYDGELLIAQNGVLLERNELLSFKNFNLISTFIDAKPNPNQAKNQSKEQEFLDAECLALFDYMRKSRSKGFVLSLSGGADSSTCAVLVHHLIKKGVEELGLEAFLKKSNFDSLIGKVSTVNEICQEFLTTAYQGTKNSSFNTFESAEKLAKSLGATFYNWDINIEVNSYIAKIEQQIERKLNWQTDDIALQNIQARSRSPIIWLLTNIKGGLLMATSNRSEGDVGYATMDGDTSGGISPIAGVDKHFIRQWLVWAEKKLGYDELSYVNNLAPSAELRPLENKQTDESDLMPYDLLAAIERKAIKEYLSPKQVFESLRGQTVYDDDILRKSVKKFFMLWSRNQWKRERLAPSFHLDDFNVDPRSWCRFPILSGGFLDELAEF